MQQQQVLTAPAFAFTTAPCVLVLSPIAVGLQRLPLRGSASRRSCSNDAGSSRQGLSTAVWPSYKRWSVPERQRVQVSVTVLIVTVVSVTVEGSCTQAPTCAV
jgi:hypothetical protein